MNVGWIDFKNKFTPIGNNIVVIIAPHKKAESNERIGIIDGKSQDTYT